MRHLPPLQAEMSRRGMQVILDGVFNHASSDGLYFDRYHRYQTDGACESLTSVWRSWFHFLDNNVPCNSSDYNGWFGFDSLPTFDHTNIAVQNFFYRAPGNVTQYWYNQGANGWRFDVADDGNFGHPWWNDYRTFAKSYNANGPLIGEIWPNASQWLAGDQMDSVMNYRFRKNITGFVRNADWSDDNNNGTNNIPGLTPSQFDHAIRAVRDDYPLQATAAMLNLLDSHDVNRALFVMTETGDTGLVQAKQRLKLAALFQFTYIGAPMVYYGDEVAINSPSLTSSANGPIGDPYTRPPYPWLDQAGDPNIYGPPDTNMQAFYTKLAHIRKMYQVLRQGNFVTLLTGDTQQQNTAPNTYAFARTMQGQAAVVVALNNGPATNQASIPMTGIYPDGTLLFDVLGNHSYTVSSGAVQVTLPALTGVLLVQGPIRNNLQAPTAIISLSSSLNGSGWTNSPVTAATACERQRRAESTSFATGSTMAQSMSPKAILPTLPISGEGSYVVGLRAIDNAGYVSRQATQAVKIDLHPPVVAVTGVRQGATYAGKAPAAGCVTTDSLSGVALNASVSITGGNGHGTGQFTATCSGGKDNAGNIAQPSASPIPSLPIETQP